MGRYLNKSYRELEKRLDEKEDTRKDSKNFREVNNRYISTTDPDASIVRVGKPKLRYHTHRAVDPAAEVITATEVTTGDVNEAHRMNSLMQAHQGNIGANANTVVADSKYGTIQNYLTCYDKGVKAHMPDLKKKQANSGLRRGIFADDRFIYDKETDTYGCPAGKRLKRKSLHEARQGIDYAASKKECGICELQPQCTKNKAGRTVKRHLRQQEIDYMRALAGSAQSKKDIKTRQHLMERSFARAKRFGFKRARWRGLWRVQIQEYITSAIQNIEILIKYGRGTRNAAAVAMEIAQRKGLNRLFDFFNNCIGTIFGKEKNRQPILCCH